MADVSKLEETGKPIDEQCIRVGAECSRPKCKDCVHYDVCYELTYHEPNGEIVGREVCNNFKDKSRFVELPCKVGDVLWTCSSVRGVFSAKVRTFFIGHPSFQGKPDNSIQMIRTTGCDIPINEFGKTVFLTREEAEKALKERNKKCK